MIARPPRRMRIASRRPETTPADTTPSAVAEPAPVTARPVASEPAAPPPPASARPEAPDELLRRQAHTIEMLVARLERESEQREEMWATIHELEMSRTAPAPENGAAAHSIRMLRYRSMVREVVPRGAVVAVASEGDAAWLDLPARVAWHYPRDAAGQHATGPFSCGLSALVHLEALRGAGAEYLVVPAPSAGVLERLPELRRHLETRFRRLRHDDVGTVYRLEVAPPGSVAAGGGGIARVIAECEERLGREPSVLDAGTRLGLARAHPDRNILEAAPDAGRLPYLDASIDVALVPSGPDAALAEARRVASAAVVRVGPGGSVDGVEWRAPRASRPLPSASIVIPTYNGWKITRDCLVALGETLPAGLAAEIVVVDDGSSDGTMDRLREWQRREPRLRPVGCARNGGFIAACNRGASAATGEVLVFLNNDTLPLPGWLEPLLRGLRDLPDAGAVGGKLIYPDGRLQEAGGIIFSDASGANFGRNDVRPDAPLYNYLRPVDYCSGALLATRRALFAELGGFDAYYAPAYYEDTDFCFRVRRHGLRVYYQPESQIVHLEGATSGTDINSGVKRHQAINRERFVERWRPLLHRQPSAPSRWDFATLHALAAGGNLLSGEAA